MIMDILLRPHQSYAAAYLDDVVVHSETWEEHLAQLRRVLLELRRAGMTANPRKCHLALFEARYLGFQVGRGEGCPESSSPSPWKPTRITCTSSSQAGRAHLRLVTAGLDKSPQHTRWGNISPEDSMLTLDLHLFQKAAFDRSTRARHGGQPLESTSTNLPGSTEH